jgi:hypothetical protein
LQQSADRKSSVAITCPIFQITEAYITFRDVDKVHDLMDDIAEQQQVADEISQAISNPIGFGQDIDEVRLFFRFIFSPSNQ